MSAKSRQSSVLETALHLCCSKDLCAKIHKYLSILLVTRVESLPNSSKKTALYGLTAYLFEWATRIKLLQIGKSICRCRLGTRGFYTVRYPVSQIQYFRISSFQSARCRPSGRNAIAVLINSQRISAEKEILGLLVTGTHMQLGILLINAAYICCSRHRYQ